MVNTIRRKMENELLVNLLLTLGVIGCVVLLGGFLLLSFFSKRLSEKYINAGGKESASALEPSSLLQKVSVWYLSKGALPFWYIFGIDCLILTFSQLIATYLMSGGQTLVPMFWDYCVLALCSLPFYYIGMKLFRSYETIVRFSTMEDLARIVCALFVGTLFVDVVKHLIPEEWLPVYPLWQEQLIMLISAVILMWSVRILVKALYDNTEQSKSRIRTFVYGTSVQSIEAGLNARRDSTGKGIILAFVRTNDKEPHTTIQGAEILNPDDDLVASMIAYNAETLLVPFAAYPDFCETHKDLIKTLLDNNMSIVLH